MPASLHDSRVVDQAIDGTARSGDDVVDRPLRAHVPGDDQEVGPLVAGSQRVESLGGDVTRDDACSLGEKALSGRLADAASGTRDDDRAAGESTRD